jgi:transcriptional regulator with XRE-family HTH domain
VVEKTDDLLPEERKFAEEVARLRKSAGWTQAQMAELLVEQGVTYMTQSTVSRVEKFQRPARVGEAEAWAHVMGRDIFRLMHPSPIDELIESSRYSVRRLREAWVGMKDAIGSYALIRGDLDGTIADLEEDAAHPDADAGRVYELRDIIQLLREQRDLEVTLPDLFHRAIAEEAADGEHPITT